MDNNFVSRKDRIIASAIEIISEAGLASLTTKNLAMKENMSESLLYRYFGGMEEVLVEVINTFIKFDDSIMATIEAKEISSLDKAVDFLKTLSSYYAGYPELGAIVLNYEEFLHNVNTRESIAACIEKRTAFVTQKVQDAMDRGEIVKKFTAEELTNLFFGCMDRDLLNRRIRYESKNYTQTAGVLLEKMASALKVRTDSLE